MKCFGRPDDTEKHDPLIYEAALPCIVLNSVADSVPVFSTDSIETLPRRLSDPRQATKKKVYRRWKAPHTAASMHNAPVDG